MSACAARLSFDGAARSRNLESSAVRAVFITDSVAVGETGWDKLHLVSIAPLIAQALEQVLNRWLDSRAV